MSAQSEPALGNRGLSIAECIPDDLMFLTEYQEQARAQVVWDEERTTIQGLNPFAYMLKGLQEESAEITEDDRVEPDYNRLGSLILLEGTPLMSGQETPSAVRRHIKEFGDVSWYLANFLYLFDIDLQFVVKPGRVAWHLNAISQPRSGPELRELVERNYSWALFSSTKLIEAAKGLSREVNGRLWPKNRDERGLDEQQLVVESGKYVVSIMHVLANRFGISYEQVLQGNRQKLDTRISNGTIFEKSGGDDR